MKGKVIKFTSRKVKKDNEELVFVDAQISVILNASFSMDYLQKMLKNANVKQSKDLIGKNVGVKLDGREYTNSDGNDAVYYYIKYMNILDADGEPIRFEYKKTEEEKESMPF